MGCGASQPAVDGLDGGGVLPTPSKPASAAAQTVTIASKPTKTVKPNTRQSTIDISANSISVGSEVKEKKRKNEHGIVPMSSLPAPSPRSAATRGSVANVPQQPLIAVPASPRSDKSRDITPQTPRNGQSASTPSHARSLQPNTAASASPRASASQSSFAIESIPESSPAAGGPTAAGSALERPRGGSQALPPLKMKGRPAAPVAAAVPDEITMTEPIGKKKKSKRNKDEPVTPTSAQALGEELATPKARVQRSASSADLSLTTPSATSRTLSRQSVVLAPLPPRAGKAEKLPRPSLMPQQQSPAQRASIMSSPPTNPNKSPSIPPSSTSVSSPSSAAAASPYFLSAEHQQQLDTYPSLWSSPTLLAAYPEAVFNHYAVIGHTVPLNSDLMFVSKKGVARLGRDSVDEWMRVWRNRLNNDTASSSAADGGASRAKEKKRAKGKQDTDGLLVLSRLLQMGKTSKKDVFRDEIDQWVVRRIRQEMQADSEGRVSKGNFVNGWRQCHKSIFNTGSDEQDKPTDGNPMACVVM